ncbi:MAG: hypothetical protein FJ100_21925 [Deltaproteobacteria bacterium]|nr:hypothetical protein [Deltaproteobacteria bacterium]
MDPDLDTKLEAEAAYVLQWALEGCAEYMRNGLGTCAAVTAATAEYRAAEDIMGACLDDVADIGEGLHVAKPAFRAAMTAWFADAGMAHVWTDKAVKEDFARRGITDSRPRGEAWQWDGLALKPEWANRERSATTGKRAGWVD